MAALRSLRARVRSVQVALFKELEADFATNDEEAKIRRRSWKVGVFDGLAMISGELSRIEVRILELLKHLDDDGD